MTIPTLPSAPLVTDIPADFNTKAFNWVAALDNWTTEANATGVAADADAATATSAAGTATTQAGTATTQAGIATSAASTATTQAGIATTKAGEANASAVAAAASAASINLNSIDINGGTIDGTVIGGSSAAAGSFTTVSASGQIQASAAGAAIKINGVAANPAYLHLDTTAQSGKIWRVGYSGGSGGSANTFDIYDQTDNINVGVFSSTGLTVTGALSASDSIRGGSGATYKFALDYSVSGDVAGELANSHASGYGYRIKGGTTSNYALLVQSQDSTNILEAKKGSVTVTGALSATDDFTQSGATPRHTFSNAAANGGVQNDNGTNYALFYGSTHATEAKNVVVNSTGGSIKLRNSASDVVVVSSTGLAVTGAVSAGNGTITGIISYSTRVEMGASSNHNLGLITNNTTQAILDTSGNLGLGVTPSAWGSSFKALQVGLTGHFAAQTAGEQIALSSNAYNNSGWKYQISGNTAELYLQDTGAHKWYTAPSGTAGNAITFTQAMTLDASGNLLVGATTGNFRLLAKRSTAGTVVGIWNTAEEATQIAFHNIAGGAVGSVTVTASTTAYNTTSDARLKENITDANDAASLIDALQVRQFDWKSDGSHQRYGFVAQELYEVAPEAVSKPQDPDEMMAVDYSKLVPMLVKEIQSLRQRVAQLEGI